MENKNILMIKHHFLNKVDIKSPIYTNQVEEHDLSDYIIVDATQRSKEWCGLSPMKIGPIKTQDGAISKTFEIFYQCSKVYPHMDTNGNPNEEYYKWRNECFNYDLTNKTAKELRHPQYNAHPNFPNEHYEHSDCIYSIYYDDNGNLIKTNNYIETRKKIYIPNYAREVVKTNEFKKLKELVNQGKKIAILDFDAYNYYNDEVKKKEYDKYISKCKKNNITPTRTLNDYLKINTIKDVINCPYLLAGHGFIIKALLQGDLEVINDQIIDNSSIYKR